MNNPIVFTTEGQVQAKDGTYLERDADAELLQLCQQGEFAYVLTSRQMGKSSLMYQTAYRLRQEGVRTAIIDLQKIGSDTATIENWYQGFLTELGRKLKLRILVQDWWQEYGHLSASQRMVLFFETVVLEKISAPVVVFVDEIDTTIKLDFTDDFFIAIRSCYTERAENVAFRRLSFVLVGVATPSDLISAPSRTSFNIGYPINLTDFTFQEALPFAAGLRLPEKQGQELLQWVLRWTGGHPYLTQRVCLEIVKQDRSNWIEKNVKKLVAQLFFGDQKDQDGHLKFVRDRLIRADDGTTTKVVEVLKTYQRIWQHREAVYDEEQSEVKAQLKLSGAVKRIGKLLKVRNAIYRKVFDQHWVEQQLAKLRPYAEGITAWLASGCQDESRLLRGQALTDAQSWATGKHLSNEDYQFLNASQQAEKQAIDLEKRLAQEQVVLLENAKLQLLEDVKKINIDQIRHSSRKQWLRNICVSIGAVLTAFTVSQLNILTHQENLIQNILYKIRGEIPWDERIVIVGIDDATLDDLGGFPISRKHYADLLDDLLAVQPAVVAFDLLLVDPSPHDEALGEAILFSGNVVLPVVTRNTGKVVKLSETLVDAANGGFIFGYGGAIFDSDGLIRQLPTWEPNADSFGLSVVKTYLRSIESLLHPDPTFRPPERVSFPRRGESVKINWPRAFSDLEFISLTELLNSPSSDHLLNSLQNKIILVGYTATGIGSTVRTPFSLDIGEHGIIYHAAIVNSILNQNWLRPLSTKVLWSLILLIELLLVALLSKFNRPSAIIFTTFILSMSWIIASVLCFIYGYILLPVISPMLAFWILSLIQIGQKIFQNSLLQQTNERVLLLVDKYVDTESESS